MKKVGLLIISMATMGAIGVSLLTPAMPAMAAGTTGGTKFADGVCGDSTIDAELRKQAGCNVKDGKLSSTAVNLINIIIAVIGLAAAAVIVIGGIMYATSLGDPGKMTQAKNMVLYAVIALVVAVLAWAIVQAVVLSVPTIDADGS